MKRLTRTWTTTVAAAALLGSLGFSAHSQPVPAPAGAPAHAAAHAHPHGPRHAPMPVDHTQQHAQRSERLHTLLQIQPRQQAVWEDYVKATTPQPRPASPAAAHTLRTPERIAQQQQLRKARLQHIEQREQATVRLYQSLNASQQKAMDALHLGGPGKHHAQPQPAAGA